MYSVTPRVVTIVPFVSVLWDKLVHQVTGTAGVTRIRTVRTCVSIALTKVGILPLLQVSFQLSRYHLQSIIDNVMIETWVTAFPWLSVSPTWFSIFQRQTVSHTIVLYIVCRWVEHDTVTIRHRSRLVWVGLTPIRVSTGYVRTTDNGFFQTWHQPVAVCSAEQLRVVFKVNQGILSLTGFYHWQDLAESIGCICTVLLVVVSRQTVYTGIHQWATCIQLYLTQHSHRPNLVRTQLVVSFSWITSRSSIPIERQLFNGNLQVGNTLVGHFLIAQTRQTKWFVAWQYSVNIRKTTKPYWWLEVEISTPEVHLTFQELTLFSSCFSQFTIGQCLKTLVYHTDSSPTTIPNILGKTVGTKWICITTEVSRVVTTTFLSNIVTISTTVNSWTEHTVTGTGSDYFIFTPVEWCCPVWLSHIRNGMRYAFHKTLEVFEILERIIWTDDWFWVLVQIVFTRSKTGEQEHQS